MIQRHTLVLLGVGVGIGLPVAMTTTLVLESFLYELGSDDAATFAIAVVILSLIALAAGYLPARRAARLETVSALRYE